MDVLPSRFAELSHLEFGTMFNQPFGFGVLPSTLSHLRFGETYNQPFGLGVLPPRLSNLIFDQYSVFNQPIGIGVLPSTLSHVTFAPIIYSRFYPPTQIDIFSSTIRIKSPFIK